MDVLEYDSGQLKPAFTAQHRLGRGGEADPIRFRLSRELRLAG